MISAISQSDSHNLGSSSLSSPISKPLSNAADNLSRTAPYTTSTVNSTNPPLTSTSSTNSSSLPKSTPFLPKSPTISGEDTVLSCSDPPSSFGSWPNSASNSNGAKTAAIKSPPPNSSPAAGNIQDPTFSITPPTTTTPTCSSPTALATRACSSGGLVSDHHLITLDHPNPGKMTSDDDSSSSLSDSILSYKKADTAISSIQEELSEKELTHEVDAPAGLSSHTFRPISSIPSLSLLYSDTAPRNAWRPQLESWLKKHHPSQLREVERATSPPPILDSLQSHWSFTAVNALHSAQIHEIKNQAIHHCRTLSTDSGERDLITRFSESAIAEDDAVIGGSSPPKKQPQHIRKSSSHTGLRKKSYGSRDLKPYSRTPPSPTLQIHGSESRPRSNSSSVTRSALTISPEDHSFVQTVTGGAPKARASSFSQSKISSSYQPLSPPTSPNGLPAVPQGSVPTFPTHTGHTTTFHCKRRCISCGSDQSPCWRPSWSASAGQLCNSCGLRYKKTNARCLTPGCGRIPAKGEWVSMKNLATKDAVTGRMQYKCLYCNGEVEVEDKHQAH